MRMCFAVRQGERGIFGVCYFVRTLVLLLCISSLQDLVLMKNIDVMFFLLQAKTNEKIFEMYDVSRTSSYCYVFFTAGFDCDENC